jgi:hypothetical protein
MSELNPQYQAIADRYIHAIEQGSTADLLQIIIAALRYELADTLQEEDDHIPGILALHIMSNIR